MRDKLTYDRSRHTDIRIDGRKARILGYRFTHHQRDKKACIVFKTKIPGGFPADLTGAGQHVFTLEIPAENGALVMGGILRTIASAPGMNEYCFEIAD